MNAIEFQAVAHDGVLDIPPEHRNALDGKTLRVVLLEAAGDAAGNGESPFARLRKVRIQGPADLSSNHDAYAVGAPDA